MPGTLIGTATPGHPGRVGSAPLPVEFAALELFNELAIGSAWTNQTGLADGGSNGTGTWQVAASITPDGQNSSLINCTTSSSFNRTIPIGVMNPTANVPGQPAAKICMIFAFQFGTLPTAATTPIASMRGYVGGVATNLAQVRVTSSGTLRTYNNVTLTGTDSTTVVSTGTTYFVVWLVDSIADTQQIRIHNSSGALL